MEEIEQGLKIGLGLAGKADDEGAAHGQVRAEGAPPGQPLQHHLRRGGAAHGLEDRRAGVLQGHVQIGQDQALGHEGDESIHLGIGIDVMQANPGLVLPQPPGQGLDVGAQGLPTPDIGAIAQVQAIGAGILGDDEQFPHPGLHQARRLVQDLADGAADQVAPQAGDDAKGTAMVAAFRDLEIGIMAGGQLDPLGGHQAGEGVMGGRHLGMDRGHDLGKGLGASNGQDLGMGVPDQVRARPQAAGHHHPAVLGQGLANGLQGLGHRRVDETAGIDDHQVRPGVAGGDGVALRPQLGEDPFGIDGRLGTAQADETDCRGTAGGEGGQG